MTPHTYIPKDPNKPWSQTGCEVCGGQPGETIHLYQLPGIELPPAISPEVRKTLDAEKTYDIIESAEDLMDSPLFRFSDANPQKSLF